MFSLKNKKAVLTGEGNGIGKAIAELFAKQGAAALILNISEAHDTEVPSTINARKETTVYKLKQRRRFRRKVGLLSHILFITGQL